ncbi:substrate-binding domain-containing protein [Streptomyces sp. NBC_00237]|uniref:substrate-binding domain-containing protein n=1 Tax=Streptomyces sp. NBC_00237 TaxID=2975687 RepID=UPI0022515B5D|nr:substrate-binding domain-containing protein [Streptomyces sp. NBC_00237]MCX5207012.1 substrate-binding domain-containing protein [Streptomyces sp. NBC_00237]
MTARELKFRALTADLRRGIQDGTWPPGSKLPTERALAAETGLSMTTVRRAYEDLVAQGLVVRRQGAGTFALGRVPGVPHHRRIVGVLVPDTTLYYPRVLQGIQEVLSEAGAQFVLACSHYDRRAEDAAVAELLLSGVHGLLLVPGLHDEDDPARRAEELLALPVPAVLVERRLTAAGPGDPTEHVCTDHQGGAYDAVRHLRSLGHERLGLVVRTDAATAAPIRSGFARAVADFGLREPVYDADVMDAWTPARADRAVAALVAGGATGALCFGDREAALVQSAARRAGLKVPDDLALVSYDNEFADVAEIPLTAVSPPKFQVGRLAAQILLRRLAEGDASPLHQVQLRPNLVVRASCGARRQ